MSIAKEDTASYNYCSIYYHREAATFTLLFAFGLAKILNIG